MFEKRHFRSQATNGGMKAVSVEEHMQRMRDIKEKFVNLMLSRRREVASASPAVPAQAAGPTATLAMETTTVLFADNEPSVTTNNPSAAPPRNGQPGALSMLADQGPKVQAVVRVMSLLNPGVRTRAHEHHLHDLRRAPVLAAQLSRLIFISFNK